MSGKMWGQINIVYYRHFDNPATGDLQEVVPGKFIAFKGPVGLRGREFRDYSDGVRVFSPFYYIDIFRDMGVSTIIRLNEPRYDAKDFTSHGFEHFDLEFEDCTCPPDEVVAAFFRIVHAAPGAVAVHCHAGLGRTGTLIALYLMQTHDFSGREAMGWLRIMRPGSVIGEQQHYLCAVHEMLQSVRGAGAPAPVGDATARSSSPPHSRHDGPGGGGWSGPVGRQQPLPPALHRTRSEPDVTVASRRPLAQPFDRRLSAPHLPGAGGPAATRAAAAPSVLAEEVKAGMLRRSASFSGRSTA